MKRWWLASLLAFTTAAGAANTFRCGSDLITKGDKPSKVLHQCGRPSDVTQTSAWRTPILWYHGHRPFYGNGLIEVPVEIWTYNTGPSNFMRELRFERGELVSVKTLGYGYRELR